MSIKIYFQILLLILKLKKMTEQFFKDKLNELDAQLLLISNNQLLNFQYICIHELRNFADKVIYRYTHKNSPRPKKIYLEEYQIDYSNIQKLIQATTIHNFTFQLSFLREKEDYIQKAIWLFEEFK